jgi:citrate synthase
VAPAQERLTAAQAAAYLGVSRQTLYAYVSRGLIASEPAEGDTRAHRYSRRSLDALKARREARRDPAASALRSGAPVLESALSLIEEGRLYYRGLDACELSRRATLEQVAALLWTGTTDVADGLFPQEPSRRRPGRGSFADRLVTCLVAERAAHPLSLAQPDLPTLRAAARTVTALFEAAGATGAGTLAERLARGWRTQRVDDLRAALVLCAEHELNASAFTARCIASTDAPVHNALLGALCALEGRRHGGAAAAAADLLADAERVGAPQACRRTLARTGVLPGFGAGSQYPDGDPRGAELVGRLRLRRQDPAARVIAFAEELGARPSVDFALAAFERHAQLPRGASFALFALGRSVGWIAHALEQAALGTLIRPRARYTGPRP